MAPYFTTALSAFGITLLCIVLLIPSARKIGLIDKPGGRKQHQGHPPLIGGISMALGLLVTLWILHPHITIAWPLLCGTLLLIAVGLWDDWKELSPKIRLLAQCIAVGIAIVGGKVLLLDLGELFPNLHVTLQLAAIPVTAFAMLSLINAINMSDGIDGLAGSLTFICFACLFILCQNTLPINELQLLVAIIACIAAFLCFNLPLLGRARIFMGDAGSLFLGLLVAWFTVTLSQSTTTAISPVIMLWIIALPLFDLCTVFFRRLKRGLSPLQPGRDHLHHRLLDAGLSAKQTLMVMTTMALVLGTIGLWGHYADIPEPIMFISFLLSYGLLIAGLSYYKSHHRPSP